MRYRKFEYGILHSAVVLFAGTPIMGLNLYNNGFSAGILAMILYPVLTSVAKNKKVVLQDKDYFDIFTHEEPIDINANKKRTEKKE